MPLQKLLFSATLTQNPEKLQQLGLHQPRLFSSVSSHNNPQAADDTHKHDRFDFPQGLTVRPELCASGKAWMRWWFLTVKASSHVGVDCTCMLFSGVLRALYDEQKASPHPPLRPAHEAPPHPLFHQLQRDGSQVGEVMQVKHGMKSPLWSAVLKSACVFSLRLYLLVQLFGGVQAAEFSSRLSPGERKKTLKEFEQGKIELWVCLAAFVKNNESYIYIYTGIRYCVGDSKLR